MSAPKPPAGAMIRLFDLAMVLFMVAMLVVASGFAVALWTHIVRGCL